MPDSPFGSQSEVATPEGKNGWGALALPWPRGTHPDSQPFLAHRTGKGHAEIFKWGCIAFWPNCVFDPELLFYSFNTVCCGLETQWNLGRPPRFSICNTSVGTRLERHLWGLTGVTGTP